MSAKKPRISLCMIVKDEGSVLARCLESAKPWVDEIIVVDTGSTDRSMDVARSHGAEVFEHPWIDDFSAARNAAIEHATGDWILSIDADEIIDTRAGEELRRVAGKSKVIGAYIPLRDERDDDKVTVSLMFRFWRNRPEMRWRYRLHEQVLTCALDLVRREGLRLAQIGGRIIHDGYRTDVMAAKKKNERNERLYGLQLVDTPDDLYVLYKYADFLRKFEDRREEVRPLLERGYELARGLSAARRHAYTFTGELCALLGLHLQDDGETARALDVTTFGVEQCSESAHLWYAHGTSLSYAGRWEDAAEAFVKCAAFHGEVMHIPPQAHITGPGARTGLIRALNHQGLHTEAADEAWSVLTDYPEDQEAVRLFVDVATAEGDWPKTTNRLIERVKGYPRCGTSWFKGGELFFRMRLFEEALPWVLRAAELFEDPGPAHGLAGECLLAAGQYEPAIDHFSRGLPGDIRCRAGILLMSLAYAIDSVEPVDPDDEPLLTEVRRMVRNLRDLGHDRLTRRLHEVGPALEEVDPAAHRFLEASLA